MKHFKVLTSAAVMGAIALALMAPSAANARTSPERSSVPVVVGTEVWGKWSGQDCTVGVVLQKSGLWAALSPRERGARYLVIAKHCVRRTTEPIEVRTANGTDVEAGSVVALADPDDLALVRIEGSPHGARTCSATSGHVICTPSTVYSPQAFNRVFLPGFTPGHETTLPMTRQGVPGPRETFCTSGAVPRSLCEWTSTSVPPAWVQNHVYAAARSTGANLLKGDSGGAVVSRTGDFYGIATDSGLYDSDHSNIDIMGYTDAARVLSDFRGYHMAPAS
ncbi:hypothetical protein BEH61_15160 (plasmid) [Clavibacter michiganensis subsp. insidiosus]|nr:hypothetical protein BEH61_15160 [Clavibacter michiganensis subsp. insidiosus]